MTHITTVKLIMAAIIFGIAIVFGLFPILTFKYKSLRFLLHCEYFSRGFFLGAGMTHLLPDALHSFAKVYPKTQYPAIAAICILTIALLQIIEHAASKLFLKPSLNRHIWLVFLMVTFLSIHSIIAGAALGFSSAIMSAIVIFIAIIAHKGAAAFSLSVQMQRQKIYPSKMIITLLCFSLMTPIGILIGSIIDPLLNASEGFLVEGIFGAIAAGTFIYIAMFNHVEIHIIKENNITVSRIVYFSLGVILMALLAIWV